MLVSWSACSVVVVLLSSAVLVPSTNALIPPQTDCYEPLGLQSGRLPDRAISSNDVFGGDWLPGHGRLNGKTGWLSGSNPAPPSSYLEIDFGEVVTVSAVGTQGHGPWGVKSYQLQYSVGGSFDTVKDSVGMPVVFSGNTDGKTEVKHNLTSPMQLRKLRFTSMTSRTNTHLLLRVEVYGCGQTALPYLDASVSCSADGLSFRAKRTTLGNPPVPKLFLNDPKCPERPRADGQDITMSWPLQGCGNKVTFANDYTYYTNTLHRMPTASAGKITTPPERLMTIVCRYSNKGQVSIGSAVQVLDEEDTVTRTSTGNHLAGIDIMDASLNHIQSTPVTVTLQDQLNMRLRILADTNNPTGIFARRCYATAKSSPTSSPSYDLLVNQCPVDPYVRVYASKPKSLIFGTQAFRFIGNNFDRLYLHCDVTFCNVDQSGGSCGQQPSCSSSSSSRGRREDEEQRTSLDARGRVHTISQGPFIVSKRSTEGRTVERNVAIETPKIRSSSSSLQISLFLLTSTFFGSQLIYKS